MRVEDIMTRTVVSVAPDMGIKDLLVFWKAHAYSGFPVVESGRVVGVVSETDLVYRDRPLKAPAFIAVLDIVIALESPQHLQEELRKTIGSQVRDVMTSPALTIEPAAEVGAAAEIMTRNRVDRLPVVDKDGQLLGIVSRSDLLRSMA